MASRDLTKRAASCPSVDQSRLDATHLRVIRIWESLYSSAQVGIQLNQTLDAITDGPSPFEAPYFDESWPFYRGAFTEDVATYFEQLLELAE